MKNYPAFKWISAGVLAAAALPSAASAATTLEYYTYGGFDTTVSGLTRMALIMSDANFKGAAALFAVAGGVFAGFQLFTGKDGWKPLVHWFLGCILFVGLIADASSTLQVYDPVKNKTQAVGSLPTAVVVSLGAMNIVERGFIDMISTAGDPLGYQESAGGVGLNLIYQAATKNLNVPDHYMEMNLQQYVGDCWGFMYDTDVTINLNTILSGNTDLLAELAKGSTGSMWLENWYTAADHSGANGGVTKYCDAAWTELSAYFGAPGTYTSMGDAICATGGAYDPTDAAQKAQCQSTMDGWVSMMVTGGSAGGPTGDAFIRQVYLSRQLSTGIAKMDPNYKSSQDFVATSAGGENFAANWGPQMRAGMFMIALMITPLLLLFVATPMWSVVMPFIFGLYLLPTVWGICDASLNQAIVSLSNQIFQEVKANGMGLNAIAFAENDSMKLLTYLNYARAGGLGLATMIITSLFRWGSGASRWGSEASGKIQSAGGAAGEEALTPQGAASAIENDTIRPTRTMANWSRNGLDNMMASAAYQGVSSVGADVEAARFGGGWNTLTNQAVHAGAVRTTEAHADAGGKSLDQAQGLGEVSAGRDTGMLEGFRQYADARGMSAGAAAEMTSAWKTIKETSGTAEGKAAEQRFADRFAGGDLIKARDVIAMVEAATDTGKAAAFAKRSGIGGAADAAGRTAEIGGLEQIGGKAGLEQAALATGQTVDGLAENVSALRNLKETKGTDAFKEVYGAATASGKFSGSLADFAEAAARSASFVGTDGRTHSLSVDGRGNVVADAAKSGQNVVDDRSHKDVSGHSSLADNSHKDISGSSSLRDDSHRKVSGHSSLVDDTTKVESGTRVNAQNERKSGNKVLVENTNVEKKDGIGGSSEEHFVVNPKTKEKVLVSGQTDNTVEDKRATGEGVTQTTLNPATGKEVLVRSEGGKTQTQHMDDKTIRIGNVVEGDLKTHLVKQSLGEDAADNVAFGVKGVSEVSGLLGNLVSLGKNTDMGKEQIQAMTKRPPTSPMPDPVYDSGSPPGTKPVIQRADPNKIKETGPNSL